MVTRRHPIRAASIFAAAASALVHGFAPSSTATTRRNNHPSSIDHQLRKVLVTPPTSSCLRNTNDGNNESNGKKDEAKRLQEKANQYRAEAEKLRLTLGLQKIDDLESDIREFMKGDETKDDASSSVLSKRENDKLQELKDRVQALVQGSLGKEEADKMLAGLSSFTTASPSAEGTILPPSSLTGEEIKSAVSYVGTLPIPVKDALAKATGYPNYDSIINMEEFVTKLYINEDTSVEKLRRLYAESFMQKMPSVTVDEKKDEEIGFAKIDSKVLMSRLEDEIGKGTRAMDLFPRSVQEIDEELLPTEFDAQVVFELLGKNLFMATEKPTRVDGGYIIRGSSKRKTASDLLDILDGKLAKSNPAWTEKYQLNFVEIYSDASEELFEDAILITPNKFPVLTSKLLSGITTAIALFSSFVFCINAYGENPVVMEKLKSAAELAQNGGVYDLTWFNELLVPLLVTLGAAQGLHEAGHLIVAWTRQVKLTSPTILPSQALPYLSFQNRLKTSPKGYADLFDIAFAGPLLGLTTSFLALLYGLQLTTTVDPATVQLLPSIPVGYLTQSALGGTIVDLVLGGGDGILINQDVATQVPLHPVAVGGFFGLIIHALDLVPIGSTDGGRMSQAVLGRVWHLTFSSVVFAVLFFTSFTSDSGILLGFLLIYSLTQRDMEIPCRNEIDKVELPRAVAALVSWILAALILVPLR